MRLKRILYVFLSFFFILGVGCKGGPQRYETVFYDVFDTVTQVTVYEMSESAAEARFQDVHERLLAYHRLFDIYHEYPDVINLCTLNQRAQNGPVHIDAELLKFLQYAKEMCVLTGGRMNPAMGSVLSLWHDAREAGLDDPENAALPSMDDLKAAALHTDIDALVLDEEDSTAYFADPNLLLDVGAVAKGYAAQRVIEALRADGAQSLLLSVGGNVASIGVRGDGKDWKVGVQSPGGDGYLAYVRVNGKSLVTSGVYQRYYTVDGKRYHHIIDPATLMPAARFSSVSVLSEDSGLADVLSTALFNMDLEEGRRLVDSLAGTEALWVDPDGTMTLSDGFPAEAVED